MHKGKTINVACACDDSYAQHAGVMIYSLLKNCSDPKKIHIFVIDNGIKKENKKKIKKLVEDFSSKISLVNANKKQVENIQERKYYGISTYFRLLLPKQTNCDKILYLDSDLLVEGDILSLRKLSFEKNFAMAVPDDPQTQEEQKDLLGMKDESIYFNAGVLYINCKKWREGRTGPKIIKFLESNPEKIIYADQDGINKVLEKKIKGLDISWNVQPVFYNDKSLEKIYGKEKIEKIKLKPNIIHFSSRFKPWHYRCIHPKKRKYWAYLRETPWNDYSCPDKGLLFMTQKLFLFVLMKIPKPLKHQVEKVLKTVNLSSLINKIKSLSR
ncbi:MAG: glycosyltransferase family 8 protein [Candidatus Paceibacteria bacterium]